MQPELTRKAPTPFGRYQLIRRIGAGGMGEVFLAKVDSSKGPRACVVKKVLPHLTENRAFVGRFLDEAKVVVQLKHANIARVYSMGDVNGEYYLAMEYVQGKTVSRLTRRLRDRHQVLPLGLILLIGERVCEGLAYAHDAKDELGVALQLVHRDLSPANVCVSYRGEVKIIDFGAAQSTLKEEQTAPRVVIGNLTYMAPEQAKKQHVDRRADIYSVGVMLWELVAWHALPQKGDPIERWRRAANPSWDAPSLHRTHVPPEVDAVLMRALSKDARDRYPDAASFGAALRALKRELAPRVQEKDLGALLSQAFAAEKASEDRVLIQTLKGVAPEREPAFVPPTALAFEHRALSAPGLEAILAGPAVGSDTPTRKQRAISLSDEDLAPTRVGFGVTFGLVENLGEAASLEQEIEASEQTFPPLEEEPPASWNFILLCGIVFGLALSCGFLAVWGWLMLTG